MLRRSLRCMASVPAASTAAVAVKRGVLRDDLADVFTADAKKTHHGFACEEVLPLPSMGMTGYRFTHSSSGAIYYHWDAEDLSNACCLTFCTPNPDDSGLTHVLEHTVLCGSKKYPVRSPFFKMCRRSLNSFMNAMTGPDATVYPFSTSNAQDFQNLLDVYLDAVFHPLLREEDFMQEGHRLEVLPKERGQKRVRVARKGVVYNEMKGALAEPGAYFNMRMMQALHPGTAFGHVMGGDPVHIPFMTHKQLVSYHKEHYHPNNCIVMTYGDLNPLPHMAALDTVFKGFSKSGSPWTKQKLWTQLKGKSAAVRLPAPLRLATTGPPESASDDGKSTATVVVSFLARPSLFRGTRDEVAEKLVAYHCLADLLTSGPGSPMYKALIDSGMGDNFSSMCGIDFESQFPCFSVGLQGVDSQSVSAYAVERRVMKTLRDVERRGFDKFRVESALHQYDLAKRHKGSQFGVEMIMAAGVYLVHGVDLLSYMNSATALTAIRDKIAQDPKGYFGKLIREHMVGNPHRVTLKMQGDEAFLDKQRKKEEKILQDAAKALTPEDVEELKAQAERLDSLQANEGGESDDAAMLPTLTTADIPLASVFDPEEATVYTAQGLSVHVATANCSGLCYVNMLLPVSQLTPEELQYVPLFCEVVAEVGAGGFDFRQFEVESNLCCTGFSCSPSCTSLADTKGLFRCGIHVSFHCLASHLQRSLSLLSLCFTKPHLTNPKAASRLKELCVGSANDFTSDFAEDTTKYAIAAASADFNTATQLYERWFGTTQQRFQDGIRQKLEGRSSAENIAALGATFATIQQKLLRRVGRVWAVCDKAHVSSTTAGLRGFLAGIDPADAGPGIAVPTLDCALRQVLSNANVDKHRLHLISSSSIDTASSCFCVPTSLHYTHPDMPLLRLAAQIIEFKYLHHAVREKGGAYSATCNVGLQSSISSVFTMESYRDPTPGNTMQQAFVNAKAWMLTPGNVTQRDIDEARLAVFGVIDEPEAPDDMGTRRNLHGISAKTFGEYRERLLAATLGDLDRVVGKHLLGEEPAKRSWCSAASGAIVASPKQCRQLSARQPLLATFDVNTDNCILPVIGDKIGVTTDDGGDGGEGEEEEEEGEEDEECEEDEEAEEAEELEEADEE